MKTSVTTQRATDFRRGFADGADGILDQLSDALYMDPTPEELSMWIATARSRIDGFRVDQDLTRLVPRREPVRPGS